MTRLKIVSDLMLSFCSVRKKKTSMLYYRVNSLLSDELVVLNVEHFLIVIL